MILQCSSCQTKFLVDSALIPPDGRDVKCAACGHVWYVEGEPAPAVEEPASVDALPNMPAFEGGTEEAPNFSVPALPTPPENLTPLKISAAAMLVLCLLTAALAFGGSVPAIAGIRAALGKGGVEGMALADVALRQKPSKSKARYVVEGSIVNESDKPQKIPVLHVALMDAENNPVVAREYEADQLLQPGESYAFKAGKLDTSFPEKVHHIQVELGN